MSDVEAGALVKKMHHSLAAVEAKTPVNTLRDVEAEASVNTLADRPGELKAKNVGKTLTDVRSASPV